jgi:hypothetical protein
MNLGPNIWGPHLWKALHMITMGYPNEPSFDDKKNYRFFFENLYHTIPCNICSENYKKHLLELPLTDKVFERKHNLVNWLIDLHNIVNKEHKKPELTYPQAYKLIYEDFYEEPKIKEKTENYNKFYPLWILIIILVVLVMIAIIYKKN